MTHATWADEPSSKVIDIGPPKAETVRYVIFCARESPKYKAPGHAYLVFAVDDAEKQECRAEAGFGFSPAKDGEKGVIPVEGELSSELVKNPGGEIPGYCRLIVKVDEEQLKAVKAVKAKWDDHEYQLVRNDCVRFADEVAEALKIKRPSRIKGLFPNTYIRKLGELN